MPGQYRRYNRDEKFSDNLHATRYEILATNLPEGFAV